MAEGLSVIVKTKLEIDEAQAQAELKKLSDGKTAIKLPIELDDKSLNSISKNPPKIKVDFDVSDAIKSLQSQLKKTKISVDLGQPGSKNRSNKVNSHWSSVFKDWTRSYDKKSPELKRTATLYKQEEAQARSYKKFIDQLNLEQTGLDKTIMNLRQMGLESDSTVQKLIQLRNNLSSIDDIAAFDNIKASIKQAKAEIDNLIVSTSGKGLMASNEILTSKIPSLDRFGQYDGIFDGKTSGIVSLRNEIDSLTADYRELAQAMSATDISDADFAKLSADLETLDARFKSVANAASIFDGSFKSVQSLERVDLQIDKLKNDVATMKIDWSAAMGVPELRAQIEAFESALEGADAINLNNLQAAFRQLKSDIKVAGKDAKSFGDSLKSAFSELKSYISAAEIFQYIKQFTSAMISEVKAIDSAMVELKKVTNLSDKQYDQFISRSASRSKELGTSMVDYIAGTADYARLGYNIVDAQALSEATNILYKVGDGIQSVDVASDAIIATMSAYGLGVSEVTSIIDKFNEVSNKTSIDTGGLVDAITRSASAMALSGASFEQTLALIVAGHETTRDAAATGTALKTLSLRIRGAEADLKDMGESTDELTSSTSKMRAEIKALSGVDIMVNDDEYKDIYDIMGEISKVYDQLSDTSQAALAEVLFGKQRANVGASILLNFDKAEKAMNAAQTSSGSAITEHERWMTSIEASEARAAAAFQQFSSTILDSGIVKFAYDTQTGILGFLTAIIDKAGTLPVVMGAISGALSMGGMGILSVSKDSLGNDALGLFGKAFKDFGKKKNDLSVIDIFNGIVGNGTSSQDALNAALNQAGLGMADISAHAADLMKNSEGAAVSTELFTKKLSGMTVAAKAASIGMKALSVVGSMAISALASLAISAAIQGIDNFVRAAEIAQEKLNEAADTAKSNYTEKSANVDSLEKQLAGINEQIDALHAKGPLTITEHEQLTLLEKQSAELNRQLAIAREMEALAGREAATAIANQIKNAMPGSINTARSPIHDGQKSFDPLSNIPIDRQALMSEISDSERYNDSFEEYDQDLIEAYRTNNKEIDRLMQSRNEAMNAGHSTEHLDTEIDNIKSNNEEIQKELRNRYELLSSMLSDVTRFEGDNLTADQVYVNSMLDYLDQLGLYFLEASGGNVYEEQFRLVKDKFSKEFSELEKYIAEHGKISPEVLQQMFPDIAQALADYGWTPEQVAQEVNAGSVQTDSAPSEVGYSQIAGSVYQATDAYKALTAAMEEQASAGSISSATFGSLIEQDANFAKFLEKTATGYQLNTDAMYDYIEAQNQYEKGLALDRIRDLEFELKNPFAEDPEGIQAEITQLKMLINEIDSATGAYARLAAAKKTANQDSMYQSVSSEYETFKEARKKGKTGTDDFQSTVDFALGENWEESGEYGSNKEAYAAAEKILKRYFSGDEKKSMNNFLADLASGGFLDENGELLDGTTVEAIATKLGTSQDAIRSLLGLLETYEKGLEIDDTVSEGDGQLADTAEKVKEYSGKITELEAEIATLQAQLDEGGHTPEAEAALQAQLAELQAEVAWYKAVIDGSGMENGAPDTPTTMSDALETMEKIKALQEELEAQGITIDVELGGDTEFLKKFFEIAGISFEGSSGGTPTTPNQLEQIEPGTPTGIGGDNTPSDTSAPVEAPAHPEDLISVDEMERFIQSLPKTEEPSVPDVANTSNAFEMPNIVDKPIVTSMPDIVDKPIEPVFAPQPVYSEPIGPAPAPQPAYESPIGPEPVNAEVTVTANTEAVSQEIVQEVESVTPPPVEVEAEVTEVEEPETEPIEFDIDDSTLDSLSSAGTDLLKNIASATSDGSLAMSAEISAKVADLQTAASELVDAKGTLAGMDELSGADAQAAASQVATAATSYATAYSELAAAVGMQQSVSVTADTTSAQSAINALSDKTVTITVRTVNVGPAGARGIKGAKGGMHLVDERGAELIEHTRQGTYELGTNSGARLTNLQPGDIVHTASETRSILSRMASTGGAFANGLSSSLSTLKNKLTSGVRNITARSTVGLNSYANSTASNIIDSLPTSVSAGKVSKLSNSRLKKYVEKLFDWIEVRLERLQNITDDWMRRASEAIGYIAKNSSLDSALKSVGTQIDETAKAYYTYMKEADAIAKKAKLSADIIQKIQNGTIALGSYDSKTQDKIKYYQDWYDKAMDLKGALADLQEQQKDIAAEKLDNILNHYQMRIDRLNAVIDHNSALIDLKGATGIQITESDYADSIEATESIIQELQNSRKALNEEFAAMLEAGYIVEGSEQWYEYKSELDELDVSIIETQQSLQELIDTSESLKLNNLQYAAKNLEAIASAISKEMDLREAQGEKASANDYDKLIHNGMAQIENLREQNAELLKQQEGLDTLSEKYQEIQEQIESNKNAILDLQISQEQWNDAVLDLHIQDIEDYKEELSKINDNFRRQRDLQQAIEDLERARTQRMVRTYREGVGFVYEANQDAIRSAQENLDQVLHNEMMSKLDDMIEAIQDLKEDNDVYDINGVLLGKEYTLPVITDFVELLNSSSSSNIVANAMQDAKNAAYQQVMETIGNIGQGNTFTIGDIIVNGVDTPDALAEALVAEFPNAILQAMYKK